MVLLLAPALVLSFALPGVLSALAEPVASVFICPEDAALGSTPAASGAVGAFVPRPEPAPAPTLVPAPTPAAVPPWPLVSAPVVAFTALWPLSVPEGAVLPISLPAANAIEEANTVTPVAAKRDQRFVFIIRISQNDYR